MDFIYNKIFLENGTYKFEIYPNKKKNINSTTAILCCAPQQYCHDLKYSFLITEKINGSNISYNNIKESFFKFNIDIKNYIIIQKNIAPNIVNSKLTIQFKIRFINQLIVNKGYSIIISQGSFGSYKNFHLLYEWDNNNDINNLIIINSQGSYFIDLNSIFYNQDYKNNLINYTIISDGTKNELYIQTTNETNEIFEFKNWVGTILGISFPLVKDNALPIPDNLVNSIFIGSEITLSTNIFNNLSCEISDLRIWNKILKKTDIISTYSSSYNNCLEIIYIPFNFLDQKCYIYNDFLPCNQCRDEKKNNDILSRNEIIYSTNYIKVKNPLFTQIESQISTLNSFLISPCNNIFSDCNKKCDFQPNNLIFNTFLLNKTLVINNITINLVKKKDVINDQYNHPSIRYAQIIDLSNSENIIENFINFIHNDIEFKYNLVLELFYIDEKKYLKIKNISDKKIIINFSKSTINKIFGWNYNQNDLFIEENSFINSPFPITNSIMDFNNYFNFIDIDNRIFELKENLENLYENNLVFSHTTVNKYNYVPNALSVINAKKIISKNKSCYNNYNIYKSILDYGKDSKKIKKLYNLQNININKCNSPFPFYTDVCNKIVDYKTNDQIRNHLITENYYKCENKVCKDESFVYFENGKPKVIPWKKNYENVTSGFFQNSNDPNFNLILTNSFNNGEIYLIWNNVNLNKNKKYNYILNFRKDETCDWISINLHYKYFQNDISELIMIQKNNTIILKSTDYGNLKFEYLNKDFLGHFYLTKQYSKIENQIIKFENEKNYSFTIQLIKDDFQLLNRSNILTIPYYKIESNNFEILTNNFVGSILYPGLNIKFFELINNGINFKISLKDNKSDSNSILDFNPDNFNNIFTSLSEDTSTNVMGMEINDNILMFWIIKSDEFLNPINNDNNRPTILKIDNIIFFLKYIKFANNKYYYLPNINEIENPVLTSSFRIIHYENTSPWFLYFNQNNKNIPKYGDCKKLQKYDTNGWSIPSAKVSKDFIYSNLGSSEILSRFTFENNLAYNEIFSTFTYNSTLTGDSGTFENNITDEEKSIAYSSIGKYYNLLQGISRSDIIVNKVKKNNFTNNDLFQIISGNQYSDINLILKINKNNNTVFWDHFSENNYSDDTLWSLQPVYDVTITKPSNFYSTRFF